MIHVIKFSDHCCNVDNTDDLAKMLEIGGVELTGDEIKTAGMAGYESLVGPANTDIGADGIIVFSMPILKEEDTPSPPVTISSDTITIPDAELLVAAAKAGEKTAEWLIAKLAL